MEEKRTLIKKFETNNDASLQKEGKKVEDEEVEDEEVEVEDEEEVEERSGMPETRFNIKSVAQRHGQRFLCPTSLY